METNRCGLQTKSCHRTRSTRRLVPLHWLLAVLCAWTLQLPYSIAHAAPRAQEQQWVTQTIRYHQDEAGEVVLIWGINDWQQVPEELRPAGTVVKGKVMYTPLVRDQNSFVIDLQVPVGANLNYIFQITKTQTGETIDALDPDGSLTEYYLTSVIPDNTIEVYSIQKLVPTAAFNLPAITPGYYGIAGLALILICAIIWLRRRLRNPYLDF